MKKWSNEEIAKVALQVFAINMQKYRTKQNITIEDLSKKTELSLKYLQNVESGYIKNPSIYKLALIAEFLKIDLSKMFQI